MPHVVELAVKLGRLGDEKGPFPLMSRMAQGTSPTSKFRTWLLSAFHHRFEALFEAACGRNSTGGATNFVGKERDRRLDFPGKVLDLTAELRPALTGSLAVVLRLSGSGVRSTDPGGQHQGVTSDPIERGCGQSVDLGERSRQTGRERMRRETDDVKAQG